MGKNIVFCADGTWNDPDEDENDDDRPDPTNVYRLFLRLDGETLFDSRHRRKEQERFLCVDGDVAQAAKYLHGVGDSDNLIEKVLGGAFGAGVISRVVRGYTFISRQYRPGDSIFIAGFSRGAYTARALAGLIASEGLLRDFLTHDRELSYERGAQAWFRWRRHVGGATMLAHLAEVAADLPAFVSRNELKDVDLVEVGSIAAVGVWDTVGAMGLPEYADDGRRKDAFKFADTTLSTKTARGFHAVSLDDRRADFTPTLWSPRDGVEQALFPGAHADVGGGYPSQKNESGLSDVALDWMTRRLDGVGVKFAADGPALAPRPDGVAHQPWISPPWDVLPQCARQFPDWMPEDPSIAARMAAGPVKADPALAPAPYRPTNRP